MSNGGISPRRRSSTRTTLSSPTRSACSSISPRSWSGYGPTSSSTPLTSGSTTRFVVTATRWLCLDARRSFRLTTRGVPTPGERFTVASRKCGCGEMSCGKRSFGTQPRAAGADSQSLAAPPRLRKPDRCQLLLEPTSLDQRLPADHLARTVWAVGPCRVDCLVLQSARGPASGRSVSVPLLSEQCLSVGRDGRA